MPDGTALEHAMEVAEVVAGNGPLAVEAVLKTLHDTPGMTEAEAFAHEDTYTGAVMASEDSRKGRRRSPRSAPRTSSASRPVSHCQSAPEGAVDARELRLDPVDPLSFGEPFHDELLDLGPVPGPWVALIAVVGLIEDDDLVAGLAERNDVVGGVVDVEIGLDLRLRSEEAEIAVGDSSLVEPLDGIGNRRPVAPVEVQAMGDDPDPDTGVGEPPQRLRNPVDRIEIAEHALLDDGMAVVILEFAGLEPRFREVPPAFERRRGLLDAEAFGHDAAKAHRVLGADAVEIDAQHERLHHGEAAQEAVRPLSALMMLPWMLAASSEATNAKRAAISSGEPKPRNPIDGFISSRSVSVART